MTAVTHIMLLLVYYTFYPGTCENTPNLDSFVVKYTFIGELTRSAP